MNEDNIKKLELELDVRIPKSYKTIMASYPFESDSVPATVHFPSNYKYILDLNQDSRDESKFTHFWKGTFFVIGTNYGGDGFFIDTDEVLPSVYRTTDNSYKLVSKLEEWVQSLVKWYIQVDLNNKEKEYDEVRSELKEVGVGTTGVELMDGWTRITVFIDSNPRENKNSFWVAYIKQEWLVGSWGGNAYRIPSKVVEFCKEVLIDKPNETMESFPPTMLAKYELEEVSNEFFDELLV